MRATRFFWMIGVVSVTFVAACGGDRGGAEPAVTATSAPQAKMSGPVMSELTVFRDAAAGAPFWDTVDWNAPSSLADVARAGRDVVGGVVTGARVETRADPLRPYEGAPTLYDVAVVLDVAAESDGSNPLSDVPLHVRIPVFWSGEGGLLRGMQPAEMIRKLVPVGVRGVFVVTETPRELATVALEAGNGRLVGYYASLDAVVGTKTATELTVALRQDLPPAPGAEAHG